MADWTPLTVVSRSLTTAEIDTFITEVSTTRTNMAMASSNDSRWLRFACLGSLVFVVSLICAGPLRSVRCGQFRGGAHCRDPAGHHHGRHCARPSTRLHRFVWWLEQCELAPLVAARRHGTTPSISVSRDKLRTVRIKHDDPKTHNVLDRRGNRDRPDQVCGNQHLHPENDRAAEGPSENLIGRSRVSRPKQRSDRKPSRQDEAREKYDSSDGFEESCDQLHRLGKGQVTHAVSRHHPPGFTPSPRRWPHLTG